MGNPIYGLDACKQKNRLRQANLRELTNMTVADRYDRKGRRLFRATRREYHRANVNITVQSVNITVQIEALLIAATASTQVVVLPDYFCAVSRARVTRALRARERL